MRQVGRRGFVAILVAVALSGCSTVPPAEQLASTLRGTTLDDAEKLLMYAQHSPSNPEASAVCRIRAAEIAWNDLGAARGSVAALASLPAEKQRAVRLYNEATAEPQRISDAGKGDEPKLRGGAYHRLDRLPAWRTWASVSKAPSG